jgi:hypothetical protein
MVIATDYYMDSSIITRYFSLYWATDKGYNLIKDCLGNMDCLNYSITSGYYFTV